ncbi:MAG: hypothetical protein KA436_06250 [Oligoflexales bacterium]|nr:hypothetical protein [Oligoflexales bacterium]
MSALNLIPNPQVMVAQAVVFFTNMYVVKKWIVNPYMRLQTERENKTVQLQLESNEKIELARIKSENLDLKISDLMKTVLQEKKMRLEKSYNEALKHLEDAKRQSTEKSAALMAELSKNFSEERTKVEALSTSLLAEVMRKIKFE